MMEKVDFLCLKVVNMEREKLIIRSESTTNADFKPKFGPNAFKMAILFKKHINYPLQISFFHQNHLSNGINSDSI